jgi:hypothetical protein
MHKKAVDPLINRYLCSDLIKIRGISAAGCLSAEIAILEEISQQSALLLCSEPFRWNARVYVQLGAKKVTAKVTDVHWEHGCLGYSTRLVFLRYKWSLKSFLPSHLLGIAGWVLETASESHLKSMAAN